MKKISIAEFPCGDWIGIYLDGRLEYEGHWPEGDDLLSILDIEYEALRMPEWAKERHYLTKTYGELLKKTNKDREEERKLNQEMDELERRLEELKKRSKGQT